MPRDLLHNIHADFSASSGDWQGHRDAIILFYTGSSFPREELDRHTAREFNRKINDLSLPNNLFLSPYDGGFTYTGDGATF